MERNIKQWENTEVEEGKEVSIGKYSVRKEVTGERRNVKRERSRNWRKGEKSVRKTRLKLEK